MESQHGVDYGDFSFTVKQFMLFQLAELASAGIPSSTALPVSGCFQVTVAPHRLRLAASDTNVHVFAETAAVSVNEEHVTYIPAKRLLALLKEAPDGDVTIAVKKNMATITVSNGASWSLKLPDSSGYPELPDTATEYTSFSREKFLSSLRGVRHAVCRDAGRQPLRQVLLADEGKTMIASDGSRFARVQADFPFAASIPATVLDDLFRMLSRSVSEEVQAGRTDDVLVFKVDSVTLAVNHHNVPFSDVTHLFKSAFANDQVFSVDRGDLEKAIRRMRINADGSTGAMALHLGPGKVILEANDKNGNAGTEQVKAVWAGAERLVVVNHSFLSDMIAASPAADCQFYLGKDVGKRKSMLLLKDEDSGFTGIMSQMPPHLVGY
jgi:DNA polymerase III sliding clamp (beta) subunit (PCNA family)